MTEPPKKDDSSKSPRAVDTVSAPEFLGGQPDELALFAIGQRPSAYQPLTAAAAANLKAAVHGILSPNFSDAVRELVKRNAAAREFVLSEQLLAAANKSVDIPPTLSRQILKNGQPALARASNRRWSLPSWQFAGGGAVAAALAITIAFYGLNQPGSPNFSVAKLDDREILSLAGGTVFRGGPQPSEKMPSESGLKYVEIDIRKGLLTAFFADDQHGNRTEEDNTIAGISGLLDEKQKVSFIFDAAIKPLLTGDMQKNLTLRVFDLSEPANDKLAAGLHVSNAGKGYFLSPAN